MSRLEQLKELKKTFDKGCITSEEMFDLVTSALLEMHIEELEDIDLIRPGFEPKSSIEFDKEKTDKIDCIEIRKNDSPISLTFGDGGIVVKNNDCSSIHPINGIDYEKEYPKAFESIKKLREENQHLRSHHSEELEEIRLLNFRLSNDNLRLTKKLFALEQLEKKINQFSKEGW